MRALSIRQPWAWLIVRPDLSGEARAEALRRGLIKDVENRTWRNAYRGPVLIHAASTKNTATFTQAREYAAALGVHNIPELQELHYGGIVGIARIADCMAPDRRSNPWHMEGAWGFKLVDIKPLPFQPVRGMLGFFEVPWSSDTQKVGQS